MGERQQVAWISGRTPQQFIDNINLATALGYSLFSTHQVPDMFMGAILYKYVTFEEEIAGAFKESATVLKLVKDEEADAGGAEAGVSGGAEGVPEEVS